MDDFLFLSSKFKYRGLLFLSLLIIKGSFDYFDRMGVLENLIEVLVMTHDFLIFFW